MAKKKSKAFTPADETMIKAFAEDIKKSWGRQVVEGEAIKDENVKAISTNSVKLDWALTKPFVEGTINEIYGEEGTGKTTFSLEVAANATLMGKPVFFFDLERKLVSAQVDMIKRLKKELFYRIRPDNGEDAVNKVHRCVTEVPGCVIIFDSLTQLLPEVEDAEGAEKQQMGAVARLAAKMVRKITGPIERNRCMALFISHITTNMNPYQGGDVTKGGRAVRDIAAQRVRLKRLGSKLIQDKETGSVIGQMTTCKVIKNNQGIAFRQVDVPIFYGKGIHKSLDLLQMAKDLALVDYKPQGGWYTYVVNGEEKKGHESDVIEEIRTNEEFRNGLIKSIYDIL